MPEAPTDVGADTATPTWSLEHPNEWAQPHLLHPYGWDGWMRRASNSVQPDASRLWLGKAARIVLGPNPKVQIGLARTLASLVVFAVMIAMAYVGVRTGWVAPRDFDVLVCAVALSSLAFYVMIRSGWTATLKDPALTVMQIMVGQALIVYDYGIMTEAHGAVLILFSVAMFFGIFNLNARATAVVCAFTIVVTAAMMVFKVRTDPAHYRVDLETTSFVFLMLTMLVLSYLAAQLFSIKMALRDRGRRLVAAIERVQELAIRDDLTGLINRRHGQAVLAANRQLIKRNDLDVWVAMLDIDHFKLINDVHGHAVGDLVLQDFAKKAKDTLRSSDLICRWGGEEFLVAMVEKKGGDPNWGLARLRRRFAETPLHVDNRAIAIQFSAGLAKCHPDEDMEAAIVRADRALYEAKRGGRNRSVAADTNRV